MVSRSLMFEMSSDDKMRNFLNFYEGRFLLHSCKKKSILMIKHFQNTYRRGVAHPLTLSCIKQQATAVENEKNVRFPLIFLHCLFVKIYAAIFLNC